MNKVVYVFKGKDFSAKTSSYENALAIKERTGLEFTRVYEKIGTPCEDVGKYVGKKLAAYVPVYRDKKLVAYMPTYH